LAIKTENTDLSKLLTTRTNALVERFIELSKGLGRIEVLSALNCEQEGLANGQALLEELAKPFSIFVCGEFNSGKSSLINRLVGEQVAEIGILPTTKTIAPVVAANLKGLAFIDSPGTNSILAEHQALTERYLERSDCVLFVTSVERPLTDSEAQFLKLVESWNRPIFVVLNKIDLLSADELKAVSDFVLLGLKTVLTESPMLFALSAKSAIGIEQLSTNLNQLLTSKQRLKYKLAGALNSLELYLTKFSSYLEHQITATERELELLKRLLQRTQRRASDMAQLFESYASQTTSVFEQISNRLELVVEEYFRFYQVVKLKLFGSEARLRSEIEQVISDAQVNQRLDALLQESAKALELSASRILEELKEDLSLFKALDPKQFNTLVVPSVSLPTIEQLSLELKTGVERGFSRFITIGGVAAATGIGAKIALVGLAEISGVFVAIALAIFGFNALPREKSRVRAGLRETFLKMG
jgi:small GTP-binding protein